MTDLFDRIVEERTERVQDVHLDLPVPTWNGDLVVRFNVLERDDIEKFANAPKRNPKLDLDFVIKATRELYIYDPEGAVNGTVTRMPENNDYVRVETDSGTSVRWDANLAEKLRIPGEITKARDVLTFCVDNNLVAVSGMATKLITWMQNTDVEIAGALVGESSAPRQ